MSLPGFPPAIVLYVVCALLIMVATIKGLALERVQRLFIGVAVGFYLFVVFKSAFVRHDAHAVNGSNGLMLCALMMLAFFQPLGSGRRLLNAALATATAFSLLTVATYNSTDAIKQMIRHSGLDPVQLRRLSARQ